MNPDTITEALQKSFRMAIGAGASFVESVQDARKWDENLQRLTTDLDSLSTEWEQKGAVTEQEARSALDNWISQQGLDTGASADSYRTVDTTAAPATSQNIEADLQELTAQVSALREELERLKGSDND